MINSFLGVYFNKRFILSYPNLQDRVFISVNCVTSVNNVAYYKFQIKAGWIMPEKLEIAMDQICCWNINMMLSYL